MKRIGTFRKPTAEDIKYVEEHMRESDRREMKRCFGVGVEWGLGHSISTSNTCYAAIASDGSVLGIFGAMRMNIVESEACLWFLSTDSVDTHKVEFARMSKMALDLICRENTDVEELVNFVDTEYEQAIRWIEWLGGDWSINSNKKGLLGGVFRRFYIVNPYYKED